jgi:hypothetical protein
MTPTHPTAAGMHDLVIEALDTETFQVIATQRFPKTAARRIRQAPDLIALYEHHADGFPTFRVARLGLVRGRE